MNEGDGHAAFTDARRDTLDDRPIGGSGLDNSGSYRYEGQPVERPRGRMDPLRTLADGAHS